jgi:chromate transporter
MSGARGFVHSQEKQGYPSFREAFLFWLKLGFISFGGPAGQIAIMHDFLVEKKRWISEGRFLHALNYCMLLPGPEAQQLATYTGWLLHGIRGGITAGLLFILPGLFVLLALSTLYVMYGKLALVIAFFNGLKPAVIAIIVVALIKIASKSLKTLFHYAVAVLSFILIYFFQTPFPVIIIGAVLLGALALRLAPSLFKSSGGFSENKDETSYLINNLSPAKFSKPAVGDILIKIAVALGLWAIPMIIGVLLGSELPFWFQLCLFFTKAAFITFGGAYAVLPYVAQTSVEKYNWLSSLEMIDGLALGETTPGPLILVLVFIGFMAGFNHHGGSILAGSLGLGLTAYYTFLPSFLFILVGSPLVERTKDNDRLKEALSIVTAAVVGVILNLSLYFGRSVLFAANQLEAFSLFWMIISFAALYHFRVNMVLWILISGLTGAAFHLFTQAN